MRSKAPPPARPSWPGRASAGELGPARRGAGPLAVPVTRLPHEAADFRVYNSCNPGHYRWRGEVTGAVSVLHSLGMPNILDRV